jgi:hypothetical protein
LFSSELQANNRFDQEYAFPEIEGGHSAAFLANGRCDRPRQCLKKATDSYSGDPIVQYLRRIDGQSELQNE